MARAINIQEEFLKQLHRDERTVKVITFEEKARKTSVGVVK